MEVYTSSDIEQKRAAVNKLESRGASKNAKAGTPVSLSGPALNAVNAVTRIQWVSLSVKNGAGDRVRTGDVQLGNQGRPLTSTT